MNEAIAGSSQRWHHPGCQTHTLPAKERSGAAPTGRKHTHTHTNKKHTLTFVCLTNKHIQASISLWHCKSWLQWSQQRATKLHSSFVSLSKHPQLLANRTPAIHRDPHMPQETMVSTDLGHKCLKLANTEQPWAVTDDRNRFVAWKVRPKHKCLKLAFRVTRS